jgi:Ca2+-binding EF-hand superfamily protein
MDQVKLVLLSKLSLNVPDQLLSQLFEKVDPNNSGTIKTLALVVVITNSSDRDMKSSLQLNTPESFDCTTPFTSTITQQITPQLPLESTVKARRPAWTVRKIEDALYQRIVQRTGKGSTLTKTLLRSFTNLQGRKTMNEGISKDQLKFTLEAMFHLPLNQDEIDSFFEKYDLKDSGYISLRDLAEGIIKGQAVCETSPGGINTVGNFTVDPNQDGKYVILYVFMIKCM